MKEKTRRQLTLRIPYLFAEVKKGNMQKSNSKLDLKVNVAAVQREELESIE
jgi:hypothetical protein